MKKLSRRDRMQRVEPVTTAASDDAQQLAADARYDEPTKAVVAEMKALLAGRHPRDLTGNEAVRFIVARHDERPPLRHSKAVMTRRIALPKAASYSQCLARL